MQLAEANFIRCVYVLIRIPLARGIGIPRHQGTGTRRIVDDADIAQRHCRRDMAVRTGKRRSEPRRLRGGIGKGHGRACIGGGVQFPIERRVGRPWGRPSAEHHAADLFGTGPLAQEIDQILTESEIDNGVFLPSTIPDDFPLFCKL